PHDQCREQLRFDTEVEHVHDYYLLRASITDSAGHAAALCAATRIEPGTSRINATEPSPRIVAPETPSTRRKLVSSDLMTTCCWPSRSSTKSPTRLPSPSTTMIKPSCNEVVRGRKPNTSCRRTIGTYCSRNQNTSPCPATRLTMSGLSWSDSMIVMSGTI